MFRLIRNTCADRLHFIFEIISSYGNGFFYQNITLLFSFCESAYIRMRLTGATVTDRRFNDLIEIFIDETELYRDSNK